MERTCRVSEKMARRGPFFVGGPLEGLLDEGQNHEAGGGGETGGYEVGGPESEGVNQLAADTTAKWLLRNSW